MVNAPAQCDHPAQRDGQHGGRLQRQDLQPGGNQACDDWALPRRVLNHLRASPCSTWPPTPPAPSASNSLPVNEDTDFSLKTKSTHTDEELKSTAFN